MSFRTRSMWWRWIACGLAVGWSAGLWAQEAPPARKAGLWGMTVDGRQTAMRFCVGNSGDDVMRQRPFDAVRERCEPTHWQRAGARIVADQKCTARGTTAVTRAEFSGDFTRAYTVDVKTTFTPPQQGVAQSNSRLEFERIGECPAGVKAGDVVLPDGRVIDPSRPYAPPARR